jgi:hypothetical protein
MVLYDPVALACLLAETRQFRDLNTGPATKRRQVKFMCGLAGSWRNTHEEGNAAKEQAEQYVVFRLCGAASV